jgi:hypothetical protein
MLDFATNEEMMICFATMLLPVFLFYKINKMNPTETRFGCWTFSHSNSNFSP